MNYRHILFILSCLSMIYKVVRLYIIDRQRRKPLPEEAKEIYSQERYKTFLDYKHDYYPVIVIGKIFDLIVNIVLIYSSFFAFVDNVSKGNNYVSLIVTFLLIFVINEIIALPTSYYSTFVIEEKYGLNKKTKRDFYKDYLINIVTTFITVIPVLLFVAFVIENISKWTNGFKINYSQSFLLVFVIVLIFIVVTFLISIIAYLIQRKRYEYYELEDGELKNKIHDLLKGCKKKIRKIEVYNESKKSVDKNAYLLKILWYRVIGIADNFINENSKNELLAVLSHEIGHLKHKKGILEYINYLRSLILFALVVWLLPNMSFIQEYVTRIVNGINRSFNLNHINYYLLFMFFSHIITPLSLCSSLLSNYISRQNEYEADANAVKEGFGEELIRTFTKMSDEELIDINPPKIIEILEHSHPSMINRIKAIRSLEKKSIKS